MEKSCAIAIQQLACRAIENLSMMLLDCKSGCSGSEYETLKRPIGILIGMIDTEILVPIYRVYPDLDDLKKDEP